MMSLFSSVSRLFRSRSVVIGLVGFALFAGGIAIDHSFIFQFVKTVWAAMIDGSGTTNQVAAFSGANTIGDSIIFDNGTNIGIGTTNPGGKLEVSGTAKGIITRVAGGSVYATLDYSGADAGEFILNKGGVGKVLITADGNSYFNGGSVGIGTAGPSGKLEVYNPSGGLGLFLNQSTANDLYMRYHVPGVRWWTVGSKANGDFWFSNESDLSAPGPLTLTSGGNVGIGTASPGTKLDVAGNIKGTQLCIGSDCRSAWPSGGGSGSTPSLQQVTDVGATTNKSITVGNLVSISQSTNPRLYLSSADPNVSPRVTDVAGNTWRFYREGGAEGTLVLFDLYANGTVDVPSGPLFVRDSVSAGSAIFTTGTNAGFFAADRSDSTKLSGFYRQGNFTRVWDSTNGDLIVIDDSPSNGNVRITGLGGLTAVGGIAAGNFINGVGWDGTVQAGSFQSSNTICLRGDCRTAWPSGGGSGSTPSLQQVTDVGATTNQTIEIAKSGLGLFLNQPSANDIYMRYHVPGVRWWTVGPKANGDFWFSNESDLSAPGPLTLTSGGNVGIGTANPQVNFKLSVEGGIYTHSSAFAVYGITDNGIGSSGVIGVGYYGVEGTGVSIGAWGLGGEEGVRGTSPDGIGVNGIGNTGNSTGVKGINLTSGCFATLGQSVEAIHSNCTSNIASDARLKRDVAPVENGLDAIMALKPVTFLWDYDAKNRQLITDKTRKAMNYGFIAQDVIKVLPDLVSESKPSPGPAGSDQLLEMKQTTFSLDYTGLIAPTVKAVQELAQQMKELKADNAKLRQEVEQLRAGSNNVNN